MNKILLFDANISKQKPNTVIDDKTSCPFCDPTNLVNILAQEDKFLWLKNKYPTNIATNPTVILETDICDAGIPDYSLTYFTKLLDFTLRQLKKMEESGLYQSVILFKNHGKLSGGSIKHSHMQIIGLENIDYREGLIPEYFQGCTVVEKGGVEVNIAQRPMINFTEINIVLNPHSKLETFAYYIQQTVRYIYSHYLMHQEVSFNLFFYNINQQLICRVVPRYPVSPYYVGYKIEQTHIPEKLLEIRDQLLQFM